MKIRYIVVDDAPFIRELIKNICGQLGAQCVGEAESGTEGYDLAARTLPDLIFMDIVLPNENGLVTIQKIKEQFSEVKVIACSTLDDSGMMQKARESGADAFVGKPFTKQQIIFELDNLFPSSREVQHE